MERKAVSIVEVVVALILLGIVAALTVPHFSQAATGPDKGLVLREDLQILRVAIERYFQDHHAYPAQHGDGENAGGTAASFVAQLSRFTDEAGHVAATRDGTHRFGPYLRDGVPGCPVALTPGSAGVRLVAGAAPPEYDARAVGAGWIYNYETGQIAANSNAKDDAGRSYELY
jgi:type II secretory pathway pseudopilin PulG